MCSGVRHVEAGLSRADDGDMMAHCNMRPVYNKRGFVAVIMPLLNLAVAPCLIILGPSIVHITDTMSLP